MSVSIPTTDGTVTIWDNELATLSLDFPGIDVHRETSKLAERIASGKGRPGPSSGALQAVRAWLKHARPPKPERAQGQRLQVQDALAECVARGLVPDTFVPAGETDWDQRKSLQAKATQGWHAKYPDAAWDESRGKLWDAP